MNPELSWDAAAYALATCVDSQLREPTFRAKPSLHKAENKEECVSKGKSAKGGRLKGDAHPVGLGELDV